MQASLHELFKQATHVTYIILSRILGLVLLGGLLNLVFLVFLYPEFKFFFTETTGAKRIFGTVLLLASVLIPLFFYFLLGKQYAIRTAVHQVVNQNQSFFTTYLIHQLFAYIDTRHEWQVMLQRLDFRGIAEKILPLYMVTRYGMPWSLRILFDVLKEVIDFVGILSEVLQEQQSTDLEQLSSIATTRLNLVIHDKLLLLIPDLTGLWILLGMNLTVFVFLKMFF